MKSIYYFLLCIFIITSCNNHTENIQTKSNTQKEVSADLLSNYKAISFDTLDVFIGNIDSNIFKFYGTQLDSVNAFLLTGKSRNEYDYSEGIFSCFKFDLNDTLIGLISREPSYYVSSVITLSLYNTWVKSIVVKYKLADSFGDAGDQSQYSTSIVKLNNELMLYSYGWASYDNSAGENPRDTTIDHWYNYSLIKLNKNHFDTISTDSAKIVTNHKEIINRLAKY